ncbi:HD domain-containing protein [Patescibacteria group bacterium]|nr:MAG: HD domain-containing protein [Patescibacteria group bacterium]
MDLTTLSVENVRSGLLKDQLPELYELQQVVENNPWHDRETTFEHTLTVVSALSEFIGQNEAIQKMLAEKVGNHTRLELLMLAAFFHDVAKKETMVVSGDRSSFSGHDKVGEEKVKPILNRLGLAENEQVRVAEIVGQHDYFHKSFDDAGNILEQSLDRFREMHPDILLETLLISLVDTSTSYLKVTKPEQYQKRIEFYQANLT